MREAIRKHLRDFIAVAALLVIGLLVTYYILQEQRVRIPVLEETPFELRADFETAQAVVPGQGQTIRVAGVRVGDVSDVEVEDGHGVVTFEIDRKYLPIYRNATVLMRPTTALKDMFFELDPGTKSAGAYEEGDTIPTSNTAPDVNLDEILAALDSDTQAYLRLLLVGAGKGLEGRARDLARVLGGIGPINHDLARLNRMVAERRHNLADLIHNLNLLTTRVGRSDDDLAALVSSANGALGAIAEQDPNVQRAVALLPSTLTQARATFGDTARFAKVLGPAFDDLRPFARHLDEANAGVRELATDATPVLRDEIRPFVRTARRPVDDLKLAADEYSAAAPRLTVLGRKLNRLGNMAAHNPNGDEPVGTKGRDEGYLYWAAWLGHNSDSVFSTADGNGFYRRLFIVLGCDQVLNLIAGASGEPDPLRSMVTGYTEAIRDQVCPPE